MADPVKTDFMWLDHPSVILNYGGRGEGKSATSHYILESRYHDKGIPCYMTAPPRVQKLVPPWLKVIGRKIPPKSAVLIDDAQLNLHARESWKNVKLDKIISMSRHRESTLIFNTQFSNRLDRNIVTSADTNVFKRPPLMGPEFERPEMRKLVKNIDDKFMELEEKNPDIDLRQWSWVISNKPRYIGWVGPTPLCTYWSEELSRW